MKMDDMTGAGWTTFDIPGDESQRGPHSIFVDLSGRIYFSGKGQIVRVNDMAGSGWVALTKSRSGAGEIVNPTGIFVR